MHHFWLILFFCSLACNSFSQPVAGTTGLLNSPSADMQADGVFSAGANYLPDAITPEPTFNYNTFNYYVSMTFLPFMEISFRMTLIRDPGNNIRNQDRSVALRFRVIKETKYLQEVMI